MPLSLTLQDALAQAQAQGLERIDAQLLLLHALGRADASRAWLLAHNSDALPSTPTRALSPCASAARRANRWPICAATKSFMV